MMLNDQQLEQARTHFLNAGSAELIHFMHCKSLSRDVGQFAVETIHAATDLAWISEASGRLTELGLFVADSCREYRFWLDRDKALPFQSTTSHLTANYFKGKSVLEIGSGMGVNLMSLSGVAAQVGGVEPVQAYFQLGEIFCDREGLTSLDVRCGSAEALPFEDNRAELVLCVSAHQYFEIRPALNEIARVLKPGGELIIIGGTLWNYLGEGLKELLHRRGGTRNFAITVVNTLSYMAAERRIITGGRFSTSRPIYPSRAAMVRWLQRAHFKEIVPPTQVGLETCFCHRLQ